MSMNMSIYFIQFTLIVCSTQGLPKYTETKVLTSSFEKGLELVSLPHFLHDF